MIFELTLLTSFTIVHLTLGVCLIVLINLAEKFVEISAELQSWLWATAFVLATLLPFMAFVQKPVNPIVSEPFDSDIVLSSAPIDGNLLTNRHSVQYPKSAENEWNVSALLIYEMINWLYGFLIVWGLGSVWRTLSVSRSLHRTRCLIKSAAPIDGKYGLSIMHSFPVLATPLASTPMAVGLFSPVILIPKFLVERFDCDSLEPIVFHELAHIERRDLWLGMFQEALAIVFWWSPVTRYINHKIHITRELACDIRAAKRLSSGKRYAQSLLDCAQLMLIQRSNVLAMGLFSKKKELTRRVDEVLKSNESKVPKTISIALVCASLAVSTIAIASSYAPNINVDTVKTSANHYSELSEQESASLLFAIQSDDANGLMMLLNNGLDINQALKDEGTALIYASKTGQFQMVKSLVDNGADVNQSALGDGNPLIAAAGGGNLELAHFLISQGADVNAEVLGDGTPLMAAVQNNNLEMVNILIAAGADIHKTASHDGTALIKAASVGSLVITSLLVDLGADVNEFLMGEETPLINAAQNNNVEVAEYLIAEGADVNLEVATGNVAPYDIRRSPLSEALKYKHKAMVALLRTHGAIEAPAE